MQRLSSTTTWFYKRVFPVLWFGALALFCAVVLWARWHPGAFQDGPPDVMLLVMPFLMAVFGIVMFRWLVFDLVDEVWLDGDWLVLTDRGQKRRVSLREVTNVNTSNTNPRRITVMLRTGSPSTFSFMPASPARFLGVFRPDPIAIELIKQVDALRQVRR